MHVHVTVNALPEALLPRLRELPKGTKVTPIRLWRGECSQIDAMFTLHFPPDAIRRMMQFPSRVAALGFEILRFKLEDDILGHPSWEYLEIHARSPSLEALDPDASYSQNLVLPEKGLFQTFRLQDWEESDRKVVELKAQGFTEIWEEAVISDSNPELDAWWCPVMP